MLESPAIAESHRSSRELLIRDWEAGVICFAVLQESSAAEEADDTVVPSRGLKVVKSGATRVAIHSPKPFTTLSLPLMTSTSPIQGFPPSLSSLELDGLIVKSPKDGDCKLRPYKVVSSSNTSIDGTCPPEDKTDVSSSVSKPECENGLLPSKKAAVPQHDITPFEGIPERVERSYDSIGPAIEQALAFSFSKEGEKRRIHDSVVSIKTKSKGQLLQSSETARKQSITVGHPSEVAEGMWLDGATTYVRERMNTRSSIDDERIRRAPKAPPDKMTEFVKLRHSLYVVREIEKASVDSRSPGAYPESTKPSRFPSEAATPLCRSLSLQSCKKTRFTVTSLSPVLSAQYEALALLFSPRSALFPQTFPFPSQLSYGLNRLLVKSSENGDYKLRPLKVVSFTDAWSVAQVYLSYNPSLEGWWRERCKPPNWAVVIRRCLSDVVSTPVTWSAMLRSPEFRTGPLPVSKLNWEWAAPATRRPSLELVWQVLKPPNRMAVRRPLNEVVGKLKFRRGRSHSPNSVRLISSFPVFCCLSTALEIGSC